MKLSRYLLLGIVALGCAGGCDSRPSASAGPSVIKTASYGALLGSPSKPLAMVFTTDVDSSLNGAFTTISKSLQAAGYTVAAVDVTCHGRDVKAGETAGLGCWSARIAGGSSDIFAPMVTSASQAITDIVGKGHAAGQNVIAVGVSRGGYAALRLAASDSRVTTVALMAPVTDLTKLEEFRGVQVPAMYGLQQHLGVYAGKHIFMQIGNSDERVGTDEALAFARGVVAAGAGNSVDLTTIITPNKGHGTAEHDFAAQWILAAESSHTRAATAAP